MRVISLGAHGLSRNVHELDAMNFGFVDFFEGSAGQERRLAYVAVGRLLIGSG